MKLKCSLVEDIYPLYEENELKPENRLAVEEHLKACSHCSELYQKGIGFTDLPIRLEEEKLPKEADDRIRLRFRLSRMKWIAAMLALVIIVTAINQYADNREKVADHLNQIYQYGETLKDISHNPYDNEFSREMLSYSASDISDLDNELNWIERSQYKSTILVNSQELDEMSRILNERYNQGLTDETDRKTIELFQKQSRTLFKMTEKEYRKFHHGYSSYFEILDIAGVSASIDKINELTYFYNRYHKLPNEMQLIKENGLKEKIRKVFHDKDAKVVLEKTIPSNDGYGVYHFELKHSGKDYDGEIDGFTGFIISADNISHSLNDKKPMNVNVLMNKADKMLKAIYGEKSHFKIERNTESPDEPNIFRFTYIPVTGENKLLEPMGSNFTIELDAGSGEFYRLSGKPALQSNEFFNKDYKELLNQATIATKAAKITGKKANAIRKGIIYSPISADYVLVYIFEGKEEWVYINAATGVVERPYVPIH
ncbi:zf-HC2 domain-containing protein [Neobacillus terrae]|uniref:zf-HC2 domain-containing protein n=1 Tax=Neobacillus terrae TaxID=3034837 RepID=UPI00140A3C7E|nr:zf-HC2 domain-containing protein [Neobacillus terrae]NHM31915.1 hypothetical protein [Neobacillus terrae]